MDKLTMEEICAYYPFGLSVLVEDALVERVESIIGNEHVGIWVLNDYEEYHIDEITPILKNIEDLDRETDPFTPLYHLRYYEDLNKWDVINDLERGLIPQVAYKKLLELGFDVFNLIGRGLAIDETELNKKIKI